MKHYWFFLSLLLCSVSCNRTSESLPEQTVQAFLTALFQIDYEQAYPMCVPDSELKSDLEQHAKSLSKLSQAALDQRRNMMSAYSFKVEKVDVNPTNDSAFVVYLVFTPEAPAPKGIASRLTMAKHENEWKIAKLL